MILVSGATATVAKYAGSPYLGQLFVPNAGNRPGSIDLPWAADNGGFNGVDVQEYLRLLADLPSGGLFVTAPDVLEDHPSTLERWHEWAPMLRACSFEPAFVLQDGCTEPPADAKVLFIGGSTEYKLGPIVAGIAQAHRGWLHMGRVNTKRRIYYAASIGCDSVDGTAASMFPDIKIPLLLKWAEGASKQGGFGW